MKDLSFASSSGDHGPFFTLALSQQGALPILSLRVSLSLMMLIIAFSFYINASLHN
uniref:Uncharacterized protein n=1 Tax=Rhizophora mucronata TaxID=61149 RepID=A0A2P2PPY1_RHIMU